MSSYSRLLANPRILHVVSKIIKNKYQYCPICLFLFFCLAKFKEILKLMMLIFFKPSYFRKWYCQYWKSMGTLCIGRTILLKFCRFLIFPTNFLRNYMVFPWKLLVLSIIQIQYWLKVTDPSVIEFEAYKTLKGIFTIILELCILMWNW